MKKIILIDDEPILLNNLKKILERYFGDKIILFLADSTEEGLNLIRQEQNIDLIISDLLFPNNTGAWLLRELIKEKNTTPICFMTGQLPEKDLEFITKYAKGVFYKPFKLGDEVIPMIESLLDFKVAA